MAILLGLTPFLMLEGLVRISGWRQPHTRTLPQVAFVSIEPLFQPDTANENCQTVPHRLVYFPRQSFPIKKPLGTKRAFFLGGSTVHGRPYGPETSMSTWLEIALQVSEPDADWQIINCGGVSYASYRLLVVLEEILHYEPDLILLYTGHNEFLEERTYGHLKPIREAQGPLALLLTRSHGLCFLMNQFHEAPAIQSAPLILPTEVDAVLDYQKGLEYYQRNDSWREAICTDFQQNVAKMIQLCEDQSVPLVLFNPGRDLRNTPPFKSEPTTGLTDSQLAEVEQLVNQSATSPEMRLASLLQALQRDPDSADLHFLLATYADVERDWELAKIHFREACDRDLCPLRILSRMQQDLLDLADEHQVPLLDVEQLFAEQSVGGIAGENWFLDHVHPTIEGHQLIALETWKLLQQEKLVTVPVDPEAAELEIQGRFQEQIRSLDPIYFTKGLQRLANLQSWAAGRGEKLKIPPESTSSDAKTSD